MRSPTRLLFENRSDADYTVMFVEMSDGGIDISVSDEVAVGSYNEDFELRFHMARSEAVILREWLIGVLKDKT